MKGVDGRVTVAGYYDGVKLTEAERAIMAAVPDNEVELRKRLGIARPEAVGRQSAGSSPVSITQHTGMELAAVGEKGAQ